jgi:hypothetical protein
VVGDDHARLAMPLDDRRQLACRASARDRGVRDCAQTLLGHVIDDVEDAEAPPVCELVVDEVCRPARVWLRLDQDRRPSPATPSPRPEPGSPKRLQPARELKHGIGVECSINDDPPTADKHDLGAPWCRHSMQR